MDARKRKKRRKGRKRMIHMYKWSGSYRLAIKNNVTATDPALAASSASKPTTFTKL